MTNVLPQITANCGELMVQGFKYCEISHNNNIITYNDTAAQVFSDRQRFGLITYRCDHAAGYFMSSNECEKCNLNCTEVTAVQLAPCPADRVQSWAGLLLGILVSLLVCGLFFRQLCRAVDSKHRNSDEGAVYKGDKVFLNGADGDSGEPPNRHVDDSAGVGYERLPTTKRKRTLISAITGLLLISFAQACNVVVVMSSDGDIKMVCDESKCAKHLITFSVRRGYEICFEGVDRRARVSMHVTDVIWRERYALDYYTSDYTVDVVTATNCCHDHDESNCADTDGRCYQEAKKRLNAQGNATVDFQCLWSNQKKFYMNCAYAVTTKRTGDRYGVFKKFMQVGSIQLTISSGPDSQKITLGDLDPTKYLNFTQLSKSAISISVVKSSSALDVHSSRSLLRVENQYYFVNSSETGKPKFNLIGDFQESLTKNEAEYAEPIIECKTASDDCRGCKCLNKKKRALKSFLERRRDFDSPKQYIIDLRVSPRIIDVFDEHDDQEIFLKLGDDPIQTRGECGVKFLGGHGCTSCENPPSIVFETSTKTDRLGLVPFHSNCSFERYTIKCDEEPTELVLRGNPDICYFRMPTLNQEFYISMKYYALGKVEPERSENCTRVFTSLRETIEHVVINGTFIGTFFGTVIFFVVSGLALITVCKLRQRCKQSYGDETVRDANDLLEL